MRVLVIGDEPRFAATLTMGLRAEGFVVVRASNGMDGLRKATENTFDVIVLDITQPGLDGLEVLQRMRSRQLWTPVLVLTSAHGDRGQTDAFDRRTDDYLSKPFAFIVLLARLRALIRGGAPERALVLTAGTLTLDPTRRVVQRNSTPIDLTPREYGVLEYLMRRKDTVVTKNDMLHGVWDAHYSGPDNIVEVYVGYVRRKIDTPFGTKTIHTLRRMGYRLDSGVHHGVN